MDEQVKNDNIINDYETKQFQELKEEVMDTLDKPEPCFGVFQGMLLLSTFSEAQRDSFHKELVKSGQFSIGKSIMDSLPAYGLMITRKRKD